MVVSPLAHWAHCNCAECTYGISAQGSGIYYPGHNTEMAMLAQISFFTMCSGSQVRRGPEVTSKVQGEQSAVLGWGLSLIV